VMDIFSELNAVASLSYGDLRARCGASNRAYFVWFRTVRLYTPPYNQQKLSGWQHRILLLPPLPAGLLNFALGISQLKSGRKRLTWLGWKRLPLSTVSSGYTSTTAIRVVAAIMGISSLDITIRQPTCRNFSTGKSGYW